MRRALIGGSLIAGLGVAVTLIALLAGGSSAQSFIKSHYSRIGVGTYRSPYPPAVVARQIVKKKKPYDRAYDPSGIFLRYRSEVVGILPDGRGSRITVEDPDRGYRHYHSYVGGRWGGYHGHISTFRGGGPGSGK
ncbi:hypothetical protein BTM25_36540 [Actinomadura rubteroloni]|uniref:DUF4247 domain-containing protein n=1 Tax=Actinomadura rubteroloni TaxID=1926885 RepID=A0A2P4UIY5_9ACTN|nr:DUF4247 domain-containing protein [Actinomadura rubteroloni]POM25013.1 hypothetical protein BTM25_36540 [Actinomadura rubteroloni]